MRILKVLAVAAAGIGLGVGAAIFTETEPANAVADDVTSRGYFKSVENDRVRAFHSPHELTLEQAETVLRAQTVTPGRAALMVIYEGPNVSVPDDQVTRAGGLQQAMAAVANPPFDQWTWRMRVNAAGNVIIDQQ